MKAIIMRWIPASGKTTWAEQYCCENENWVRISKDDIRILFPQSKEKQIHKIQYDMIRRSFEVWKNVIIDNTHISEPSTVGGDFFCNNNNLTWLEWCPTTVGGIFNCSNNKIISLE